MGSANANCCAERVGDDGKLLIVRSGKALVRCKIMPMYMQEKPLWIVGKSSRELLSMRCTVGASEDWRSKHGGGKVTKTRNKSLDEKGKNTN